jgi:type 2 lantibiotic biosynthesis protein LanM
MRRDLWHEVKSLDDDATFRTFLDTHRLVPERFVQLLGLPAEKLAWHLEAVPGWLALARQSLNDRGPAMLSTEAEPVLAYLRPVLPLASAEAQRLESCLRRLAKGGMAPIQREAALDEYHRTTYGSLLDIVIKAMVVEMHIASRSGGLHEREPGARFEEFVARYADAEACIRFLDLYPVIVRLAATQVRYHSEAILESSRRVAADRAALDRHFGHGAGLGRVVGLELGLGDTHRGGRSVARLDFESGTRVVYKPRSLAIDLHYQRILGCLSQRMVNRLHFESPRCLDRGNYGYMEFIQARPCASQAEIRRFYFRHGAQLALLYVLGGTDFHHENVIARGEQPILIDLETLLTPEARVPVLGPAEAPAEAAVRDSVLRTGLLPYRVRIDAELEPVDLSGLGSPGGEKASIRVPVWHGVGTDSMRLLREDTTLPQADNLPVPDRASFSPSDFESDFESGFVEAFAALREHRDTFAEMLAETTGADIRCVLRPTYEYAFLLTESHHPFHLGDALDRDRYFDQLWARSVHEPKLRHIYRFEKRDLWQGDIPYFTSRPDSRSLWTSSGEEIDEFFAHSGLDDATRRLGKLDDLTLCRQLLFLRTALSNSLPWRSRRGWSKRLVLASGSSPVDHALGIGAHLARHAFVEGGKATWITFLESEEGEYSPVVAGSDLYSGLPGIALFLAYLGRLTDLQEHVDLAEKALGSLTSILLREPSAPSSVGAFDGVGGILYTLAHLDTLIDDPSIPDLIDHQLQRAEDLIAKASSVDVVGGAAGCLLALLACHRSPRRCARALTVARCYGDLLLDRAREAGGEGWMPADGWQLLDRGFGHGPLGVVYALHQLSLETRDPRYAEPVDETLERLRVTKHGESNRRVASLSWCRGTSGSLGSLMRIAAAGQYQVEDLLGEQADWMLRQRLSDCDCPCHGELGNVDVFLGPHSDIISCRQHVAEARARKIVARGSSQGWACGTPAPSPGLMDGLAGIGFQLLRLASYDLPSVLFLEPPRGRPGARPV